MVAASVQHTHSYRAMMACHTPQKLQLAFLADLIAAAKMYVLAACPHERLQQASTWLTPGNTRA